MDIDEASFPSFHHISTVTIRQSSAYESVELRRIINLTPWDLQLPFNTLRAFFSQSPLNSPINLMVTYLESSLSQALRHLFALFGRLAATTHHHSTNCPLSLSISIDCNDEGAELIVAKAETVSAEDVLARQTSLPNSFFPLNGAIYHDGHVLPLLSVQLDDSIFLAFFMNHTVVFLALHQLMVKDIPFYQHFPSPITRSLVLGASLRLHVVDLHLQLTRYNPPPHAEAYFYFSKKTIMDLKAKANDEAINTDIQISSLQSLLAHPWRSMSRAKKLLPKHVTGYYFSTGRRETLRPPLPTASGTRC